MVNVIFHLDRQGDYYFNNMLLMVFLVPRCPTPRDVYRSRDVEGLRTSLRETQAVRRVNQARKMSMYVSIPDHLCGWNMYIHIISLDPTCKDTIAL